MTANEEVMTNAEAVEKLRAISQGNFGAFGYPRSECAVYYTTANGQRTGKGIGYAAAIADAMKETP